jgi:hypothetical protein
MGGSQPPFMYQSVSRDDERFPAVKFDPKAVTRASYESKKPKPKPDGPLVSFNRHPDALMVPNGRNKFSPMGHKTKSWIKGMRVVQMCLRVVQAIAAVGLIVAMSVSGLGGWVVIVTVSYLFNCDSDTQSTNHRHSVALSFSTAPTASSIMSGQQALELRARLRATSYSPASLTSAFCPCTRTVPS